MKIQLKSSKIYTGKLNQDGQLCNFYAPLFNLQNENTALLGDFTTKSLNFDLEHPVDIEIQPAYDGAVNLILNDGKNIPRLINTRFSVLGDNKFRVTDHTGFKDTNIYEESLFDIDSSLKTIAVKIPKVTFNGLIDNGGLMPCGSYSFYFKLADADGNETEVLAESGIVLCHIGKTNDPFSIRMGQADENTDKAIKLQLSNIDAGFDYVHVYYARKTSAAGSNVATTYHRIYFDYPVLFDGTANITITGAETIKLIPQESLQTTYASIDSSRALVVSNNTLLLGNLNAPYRDYVKLQQISWKIKISCESNSGVVGSLNNQYYDQQSKDLDDEFCYYNTKNVYYRLGYWPDEVYRFGIVYIFEDNSLSPVMNLLGIDLDLDDDPDIENWFEKTNSVSTSKAYYREYLTEPEDFYFNKKLRTNSKGVVHIKKLQNYTCNEGIFTPAPISIKFDLSYIGFEQGETINNFTSCKDVLKELGVKGFFFVRLKRIPTILGQGIAIGKLDKDRGSLPVLMDNEDKTFYYQSFVELKEYTEETHWPVFAPKQINTAAIHLVENGTTQSHSIEMNEKEKECCVDGYNTKLCKCSALLVPDAELQEGVFNDLFCSNNYTLNEIGTVGFNLELIQETPSLLKFHTLATQDKSEAFVCKLTNVPEDTKIITDGIEYFSTLAGSASEAYKTSDVVFPWKNTVPQALTNSLTIVRGLWGPFVGVGMEGDTELTYGSIYNIKNESFLSSNGLDLCYLQYFLSSEMFYAISERYVVDEITTITTTKTCYRGDCFTSLFTHRMFRNFIDPELPTNDKIVDPSCWEKNYLVLNTNHISKAAPINFKQDSSTDGKDGKRYPVGCVEEMKDVNDNNVTAFSNALVQSFEICLVADAGWKEGDIKLTSNVEQEISPAGAVLKTIFKPYSGAWETHGVASINRADVNAVGLGQWVTFPICSSINLAMRDVDFSNATEEASFNRKRSFYPLHKMDVHNPLRDSNVINTAAKISIPDRLYINYPNLPYNKQEYHTRILYSLIDTAGSFTNLFKVLLDNAYVDYPKTLGEIVKLVALNDYVYVICKHGIGLIQVRLDAKEGENRLSAMQVLSDTYGTMWKESVVVTDSFIYGVDTIAKKIWQILGAKVVVISDLRVEKFLIDNIDLSELTMKPYIGRINVKSHYNAFKHDVIFTYYNDIPIGYDGNAITNEYDIKSATWTDLENKIKEWQTGKIWSLCWNETLLCFLTFYDWTPIASENIDNIHFSFDREGAINLDSTIETFVNVPSNKDNNESYYIVGNTINANVFEPIKNRQELVYTVKSKGNKSIGVNYRIPNPNQLCYFYIKPIEEIQISYGSLVVTLLASNNWNLCYFNTNNITSLYIKTVGKVPTLGSNVAVISRIYLKEYNNEFENKRIIVEQYPYSTNIDKTLPFRNSLNSLFLWKHGQAGLYDNLGKIKPTNWYGKQHEFNFEFVVKDNMPVQKIFNNLKLISNKVEPAKFEHEIVGEGYEWWPYKPIIQWINSLETDSNNPYEWFKYVLSNDISTISAAFPDFPLFKYNNVTRINKIPYLKIELTDRKGRKDRSYNSEDFWTGLTTNNLYKFNSGETVIKYDELLNEYRLHDELLINNMSKYGRIRGNALYLEDFWNIEIRPLKFTWLGLQKTPLLQSEISADSGVTVSAQNGEVTLITTPSNGGAFRFITPTSALETTVTLLINNQTNTDIEVFVNGQATSNLTEKSTTLTLTLIPGLENEIAFSGAVIIKPENSSIVIDLLISKTTETRHRDKYLKVKVRYDGTDLAVILAILSMFDYSYA